jgi:hypothetical protein
MQSDAALCPGASTELGPSPVPDGIPYLRYLEFSHKSVLQQCQHACSLHLWHRPSNPRLRLAHASSQSCSPAVTTMPVGEPFSKLAHSRPVESAARHADPATLALLKGLYPALCCPTPKASISRFGVAVPSSTLYRISPLTVNLTHHAADYDHAELAAAGLRRPQRRGRGRPVPAAPDLRWMPPGQSKMPRHFGRGVSPLS